MNHRLVNLLVKKLSGGRPSFHLHRINPRTPILPYQQRKLADPTSAKENSPVLARLPPATISFDWPSPSNHTGWMNFVALNNDIIAVDHEGRTLLYDSALRALCNMPWMINPMPKIISFTAGDGLYVLSRPAGMARQAHHLQALSLKSWQCWRHLQPLPFGAVDIKRDPTYSAAYKLSLEEADEPYEIGAYTVVSDSAFWVSTAGAGTYSFDIAHPTDVVGKWSKIGCWALPFRGRAEYVSEHRLWFGFSPKNENLCAADLLQEPPVLPRRDFPLRHLWEEPPPPDLWTPTASHLLPLGSGRLCLARFFRQTKGKKLSPSGYMQQRAESFVVLAGVEIVQDAGTGGLQMISHRSVRYGVGHDVVEPVP